MYCERDPSYISFFFLGFVFKHTQLMYGISHSCCLTYCTRIFKYLGRTEAV